MTKTCSSCGAATAAEARFCRRCGAPLRGAASAPDENFVSPQAATIPLTEEARPTHDLSTDDLARPGPETARVDRAELDELLRQAASRAGQIDAPEPPPETQVLPVREAQKARAEEDLALKTVFDVRLQAPREQPPAAGAARADAPTPGDATPPNVGPPAPHFVPAPEGDGEELTISGARPDGAHLFPTTPRQVTPHQPPPAAHVPAPPTGVAPPAPKSRARGLWWAAAAASLFLLLLTVGAVWLGVGYFRKRETALPASEPVAPSARQLSEERAAEAEALLAAGDLDGAVARLREATAADPSNTGALRRLGDLLLDNGRRREAIEVLRALTQRDPRHAEAWRSLARAQLDESLFAEAAESYRRLVALGGESALTDNELLSYAESLRLSDRADEARPLYERLSASTFADVANAARQRLSELASAQPTPAASPGQTPQDPRAQQQQQHANQPAQATLSPTPGAPTPAPPAPTPPPRQQPTPAPALSASEHFSRGEQLWASSRAQALGEFRSAAAKGNVDAYYYLGLAIVQGRDPGSLQRAELVTALQYFQNARRGGRFRADAQRYEEQLGREFDKRRR